EEPLRYAVRQIQAQLAAAKPRADASFRVSAYPGETVYSPKHFLRAGGRVCSNMRKPIVTLAGAAGVTAMVLAGSSVRGRAAGPDTAIRPVPAHATAARPVNRSAEARDVIEESCLTCHDNDKQKGDLSLETFDPAKAEARADVAEKMVKKLRAGMMPPPGADRPPDASVELLVTTLENRLDAAADANPNPGHRTFQ